MHIVTKGSNDLTESPEVLELSQYLVDAPSKQS